MRQEAVIPINPSPAGSRIAGADQSTQAGAGAIAPGNALVPVLRSLQNTSSRLLVDVRPAVPFLTQLIATAEREPQTRTHRRLDPAQAIAAYAAAMRSVHVPQP